MTIPRGILLFYPVLPMFNVEGLGFVHTLAELGAALAANPAANVTMRGDYDAIREGVFSASPLAATNAVAYTGRFNGAGHTISNFQLLDADPTPGLEDGLFGNVGDHSGNGWVENLTLSGSIVQTNWERTTRDGAGRYLFGTTIGGIVGFLRGTLDNCTSNMFVEGAGSGGQHGGMVGRSDTWTPKVITGITNANPGVVTFNAPHGMPNGVRLHLSEIVGTTELNGQIVTITSTGASSVSIGVDTTAMGAYVSDGIATGAGTVKNCTTNATVVFNRYNYMPYFSPLVASNRGLIENCVATSDASVTVPSGYSVNPATADYADGATFTGSISGTTLTVTAMGIPSPAQPTHPGIVAGLYLFVPNTVPGTVAASGLRIVSQLTGTAGRTGTYTVSTAQTISSRDWAAAAGAPGTYPVTGAWLGGICGDNGWPDDGPMSIVRNCISFATLTNSNTTNAGNFTGGICGFLGQGIIEDCISAGLTLGANSMGGIVGHSGASVGYSAVKRCISLGDVLSQRDVFGNYGANQGGIGGQITSGEFIDNTSYSNTLGGDAVGGAVGLLRGGGVVTRLVSFGTATGGVNTDGTSGSGTGGLIGQTLNGCVVDQAFCTGVAVGQGRVGGCIGVVQAGSTLTNVYWDIDSTGTAAGIGQGSSSGVTGLGDAALLSGIPAGFDAVWARDASQSSFYPYITTLPFDRLAGGVLPPPTIDLDPPLSLSFVGAGTSVDSTTVLMPDGIRSGDWCWLVQSSINTLTAIPVNVTPTGFTFILQDILGVTHGIRTATAYRILDGTETTVTGIVSGTRGAFKALLVFRPSNPGPPTRTWTRLNPHVKSNGAGTGVPSQSMLAGTSPCLIVAASITDGGVNPTPVISTGDNDAFTLTSIATPSLVAKIGYRINNTGAAASIANADTTNGVAVACVNVSLS